MNNSSMRGTDREGASVFEQKLTRWKNTTSHSQRVILFGADNRPFKVTFEPGEEKTIPSEYDRAIHTVDCGRDECHAAPAGGWYCNKGHDGQIVAGLAPLLTRIGSQERLDPSLDPNLALKKQAEAEMASAAISKQAVEDALLVASARAAAAASRSDKSDKK